MKYKDNTNNISNNSNTFIYLQGNIEAAINRDWRYLITAFITSQDVSESSRKLYSRTLSLYFKWMEREHKQPCVPTRLDVLSYKDHLQERKLSALTISSYITSVRKFFEWAEIEGIYPNIARGIKTPHHHQAFKKQHLTRQKCRELLKHTKSESIRNYAIINLILRTGLRTIEVTRANIEDITFKADRRILRVWGKGHTEKDDFVVLSDKAYIPIQNYLAISRRGARPGEPLFTSISHNNFGDRLTTKTISAICKDALKAIGLDGREFTAHSLRHTTAVTILKQGGQLTDVQSVLRHTSPVTSQIYTESIKEELRLQHAPELYLDAAF